MPLQSSDTFETSRLGTSPGRGVGQVMFRNLMCILAVFLISAATTFGQASPTQQSSVRKTDLYGDPLSEGAIARMGTVRLRHSEADIAYSVDGKTLISGGETQDVRFWDASTGKELRRV